MKKYFIALKGGLASAMEQRFDFFAGLFSTIFPIIIQVFLWTAIYSGSGNVMYGYTFPQMMLYVAMAGAVSLLVDTGIENTVNQDIHTGTLGIYICKPLNYFLYRVFHTLGKRLPATVITLLFATVMLITTWLTVGLHTSIITIIFFVFTLAFGIALNFCLFYLISLSGMWITEAGNFFSTIRVVAMVISGGVFPVTVLGGTFVAITKYLPFMYITYFPVTVITGALPVPQMIKVCLIQILWISVLCLLSHFAWNRGMRKFANVGG